MRERQRLRGRLAAERANRRRRRADPGEAGVDHGLGEVGVLAQETVARVHRVGTGGAVRDRRLAGRPAAAQHAARRQHSRQPANHHRAFYSICTDKRTQVRVLLHVGGTQRFHGGGYAYVCIYCCCVWFALATATNIIDCSDHEDCFLLRNRCGLCYGLCPFGQAWG